MQPIRIRKAEAQDCAQILQLIKDLAEYEKALEQVTVSYEHFHDSGFGPKPVWEAWLAVDGDEIIGMALCYMRFSTWKGQRLYLEDLYVKTERRREGIGHLMMDELIDVATERKLHGIAWQVLEWNDLAIGFYKKYNASFDKEWVNCAIEIQAKTA